ncbi:unnamed protein product [Trichobilharzia regenti]|uniref:Laminin N-terminal domain-containing protein n=1 Tax=Trichobilharzia regenti TaxID=157069 RepID=A0A183WIB0_TRIRE|nr:unnamed protein product [Trichobilharzia regenti]VDQ07743.1 unnamed protein product [Trichobilharzia regenti]
MITFYGLETHNVHNISINATTYLSNSTVLLTTSEKVELQPGLIALVSLMAFVLLVMIATLLLPKSIQDNLFQLILNQTPDQTFNYIDVGLYKTRHSIYRKEVYSLAMQGNQYRKREETHTLLSSDKSSNSYKYKNNRQLRPLATKSVIASVSTPEDYEKSDQCSCSTSVCKSTLSSCNCQIQNDSVQMKNTKLVTFSTKTCCHENDDDENNHNHNCNKNIDTNVSCESCMYAGSRRNSTSNLVRYDSSTWNSFNLLTTSLNTRYSLPLRFTQSNQSIDSLKRLPSSPIFPKSKQSLLSSKRVRLQLSDIYVDRCK